MQDSLTVRPMKTFVLRFAAAILRTLLRIRYRVRIEGIENLASENAVLVLPNHVALIDPVILTAFFAPSKILSPLVSETYYSIPAFKPLFDLAGAVAIADIKRGAGTA